MKVLIDTNIVLDVMLKREPWLADSQRIWQACDDGRLQGYIVASTLTDIYYIARKMVGREVALAGVEVCLITFVIAPIDRTVVERAIQLVGRDFEDNIQIAVALQTNVDAIVTRNPNHFLNAVIPVLTPQTLLAQFS